MSINSKKQNPEGPPEKALWTRTDIDPVDLTDGQIGFLTDCLEENLEHARHVENERLTFNSIFMALVAGVLAFVYSLPATYGFFAILVTLLLMVVGIIAMQLTHRWDNTFDRHTHYAKMCYRLIHLHFFPENTDTEGVMDGNEMLPGLSELPAYCFRPKNPADAGFVKRRINKIRTRTLFAAFYWLIEAVLLCSLIYFVTAMYF